jgi:mono/diheme cytochrome c family protein
MTKRTVLGGASALVAAVWASGSVLPSAAAAEDRIDFEKQIRPILVAHCYECHGPEVENRESDLRLDRREFAFVDFGGYKNIVPGDPEDSELYLRISSGLDEERMPPAGEGTGLTDEQIATIRKWIEEGAEWVDD